MKNLNRITQRITGLAMLLVFGLGCMNAAFAARTTTYLHTDALGSVVAASNDQGALLWRKQYSPYGVQIDSDDDDEAQSYTGKQHDTSTGLTYYGARYYDPEIGRFMGADPASVLGHIESNPMMFNRYAYANNNPYRYVDPDGRIALIPWVIGGIATLLDLGMTVGRENEPGDDSINPTLHVFPGGLSLGKSAAKATDNVIDVTKATGTALANFPKATGFASQKAFRQHWKKHVQKGNEWGTPMTESQYLARAKKFLSGPPDKHTLEYQRFNGQTVRYSTRTGEYGVVGADGTISTLFRPATSKRGGDGLQYFLNDRMKNVGY